MDLLETACAEDFRDMLLAHIGFDAFREPWVYLISDPEILLQLIALIYIPEGESQEGRPEPSEAERAAATQAWRILHEWKPFANTPPQAMPSSEELAAIVEQVRKLAAERRHSGFVDEHLGKALASSPAGTDGVWPHESVGP